MFGHLRGSSIFSQLRKAFRRNSNSHSGSFFLAEIKRTVSSLKPRGIVSDSMSVTQPYLYSRFVSISAVLIVLFALNQLSAAVRAAAVVSGSDATSRQPLLRCRLVGPV